MLLFFIPVVTCMYLQHINSIHKTQGAGWGRGRKKKKKIKAEIPNSNLNYVFESIFIEISSCASNIYWSK